MLDVEQYQITGSTAREIADSAEAAIRDGALRAGDALPTVRALAASLGKSPATINSAYRILRQRGLAVADGRRGTRVAPRPAVRTPASSRHQYAPPHDVPARRDLTIGLADPALLPPVGPAIARIDLEDKLAITGLDTAADDELLELAAGWFEADGVVDASLTVVSGALDGVERVLQAHLRPGDRVVVEDPCYPPIRDILLALALVAVPVAVDDQGLVPDALEARLAKGVEAILVVPRAQNPLGSAIDDHRARELRALLERHPGVLIVEDDHASIVSGAPYASMIGPSWPRWAVIRALSKFLNPDLRLAIVAGDETTIARLDGRQALGPRWVSRILQATAVQLLKDPEFDAVVARARDAYTARREALIGALAQRGVPAHGRSGLNVWVPVREEAPVVRELLDAGWLVLSGERFRFATPPGIRLTTAMLDERDAREVADVIAAVEQASTPRRAY
jgi:DNA-binding transcriptional MocR family regulator